MYESRLSYFNDKARINCCKPPSVYQRGRPSRPRQNCHSCIFENKENSNLRICIQYLGHHSKTTCQKSAKPMRYRVRPKFEFYRKSLLMTLLDLYYPNLSFVSLSVLFCRYQSLSVLTSPLMSFLVLYLYSLVLFRPYQSFCVLISSFLPLLVLFVPLISQLILFPLTIPCLSLLVLLCPLINVLTGPFPSFTVVTCPFLSFLVLLCPCQSFSVLISPFPS